MPDVVSVRQTGSSPPASFRFLVTEDTLALGYVLGTINPHLGLSPVRLRPCWAHHKKRLDYDNQAVFYVRTCDIL
jgi:hypothetical protein